MQHKQQQNVITLYALFGCKVARIEAAKNQAILIGLTALRQSIRKAMEAITNQVKHMRLSAGAYPAAVLLLFCPAFTHGSSKLASYQNSTPAVMSQVLVHHALLCHVSMIVQ